MFVYLSKKIAIPNGVRLHSIAWNSEQGWIACGGENGLLKVLKLDVDRHAASNLSMNQTLDGHEGAVGVVGWNDQYRKLTSSDKNGLIIVWMLHNGMWFEEMINNRNKSVVTDLSWTADGQKICICYDDGAVIVGSVDGNRLWGRELHSSGRPLHLTHVQWSPDGKTLLFGTNSGEIHRYDASTGHFISKLTALPCIEDSPGAKLIGLQWYAAADAATADISHEIAPPSLAICYGNGRCQLMRNEADDRPILIDTGMKAHKIKWNCQGNVLAIGGTQSISLPDGGKKDLQVVQFYSNTGQHLRTLKVPGSGIASIAWEGNGLRLALAVDSFIYFANVRPDYKWAYFNKVLAYAYLKPGRSDHTCVFWNVKTAEKNVIRNVPKLVNIAASATGDNCALVRKDEQTGQHVIVLCNAIGSPIDNRYIDIDPLSVCMNMTHVVVTSDSSVYVWQFRALASKADTLDPQAATAQRKESRETFFHIDDVHVQESAPAKPRTTSTTDQICVSALSSKLLIVGRETGLVQCYTLSPLKLVHKFHMACRPQRLEINCNATRLAVIDVSSNLSFYQIPSQDRWSVQPQMGEAQRFERKDVWDMRWSTDDEDLFAMMEKTRMYIVRGLDPEEPIASSACLCTFGDLKIKAVLLDEIMSDPEHPQKDCVINFDTKALRDARTLLQTSIEESCVFIEQHPHPKLWGLLAEKALEKLNFVVAERAFVNCHDYQGLQFVKKLKQLEKHSVKQHAEIAAYFLRFDDAERLYRNIDRRDLAAELRMRLGDWFKVVQLVQEGGLDDVHIQEAWDNIGHYYADRQKWSKAVQYYNQAKNYEKLVEYYFILEDYRNMQALVDVLPVGSPLLVSLGHKFATVGLSNDAVSSFLRAENVKLAVDACIELNQWSRAVQLAEQYKLPEIRNYLAKYAGHLLEKGDIGQAIELYQKAEYYPEAAKLLSKLASEAARKQNFVRAKKFSVLAALAIDSYKQKMLDAKGTGTNMVDALLETDKATASDRTLVNAWKGAEGHHLFLLAQQQLQSQQVERAMVTAMRLTEYDDILEEGDLYTLIALVSYLNKSYSICSRAFIRLETLEARVAGAAKKTGEGAAEETEEGGDYFTHLDTRNSSVLTSMGSLTRKVLKGGTSAFAHTSGAVTLEEPPHPMQDLAYKIFTRHPPTDNTPSTPCWKCKYPLKEWFSSCPQCSIGFQWCIISGRLIHSESSSPEHRVETCRRCKHKMYRSELQVKKWRHCFLCHHPLESQF
eukprot:TRINITY_DN1185_c0_g1_i1.p1 TRINITY_DN1185_c0_g1~~TRINITY_DN1185_c0_g1_i1.p1  ORF type:complete len:1246 (+),score=479.60 TRINITY_DN1185_c0_g1_i1:153-3890(+)